MFIALAIAAVIAFFLGYNVVAGAFIAVGLFVLAAYMVVAVSQDKRGFSHA